MKNRKIALLVLIITAIFTACHTGTHVIVTSDDNNTNIKLEYWGTVILDSDRSAITSISHDGFIDYKKNNDELRITNGSNGHFNYELNGNKTGALDAGGRALLTETIQRIAKVQAGH
jgi:hypothetical protein